MKYLLNQKVSYGDVGPDFKARLPVLGRMLQEAAVCHSEKVGKGSQTMFDQGVIWVLSKLSLSIERLPLLDEELSVTTWHAGLRGFFARRDFTVEAEAGPVLSATSVWLYLDLNNKRAIKIPIEASEAYGPESDKALDEDLARWSPDKSPQTDFVQSMNIRASDFDPLGHVNNTVYLDLAHSIYASLTGKPAVPSRLRIAFLREIGADVPEVTAGISKSTSPHAFSISRDGAVFAAGEIA